MPDLSRRRADLFDARQIMRYVGMAERTAGRCWASAAGADRGRSRTVWGSIQAKRLLLLAIACFCQAG
jgi:hypothetical protein